MIGLLLITHGGLGDALVQCAGHILGQPPPRLAQLGVDAADKPAELLPRARRLLREVDAGAGVLLLADVCAATPANIARQLLEPGRVEGLVGVNLPMLLRALTYREQDLATLMQRAAAGGRDGILSLREACDAPR